MVAPVAPVGSCVGTNADVNWDNFDSDEYFEHNYLTLREDDREIIERMSDHFAEAMPLRGHGIDVGSGTNLYPTLAMLPWAYRVTLREQAHTNCAWLENQLHRKLSDAWNPYWDTLVGRHQEYQPIDLQVALESRSEVQCGSIFRLPAATYDIGTMFFVAESITGDRREFQRATRSFVGSLKPRAPFAAAFMKGSHGYHVGRSFFPAVAITEADVRECLSSVANDVNVHPIESNKPLREGVGMMLATGRAKKR